MNLHAAVTSWRTTIIGVATIVLAIWTGVAEPLLDADPSTNPMYEYMIAQIILGIGMITGRDAAVSSKSSGVE